MSKRIFSLILAVGVALLSSCSNADADAVTLDETTVEEYGTVYDWGTAPETEPPDTTAYTYAFSRYAVTENRLAAMSEGCYQSYMALIDAIESFQPQIEVSEADVGAIMETLCECYPPIRLVSSFSFAVPEPVADTGAVETDADGNPIETAETESEAVETEAAETEAVETDEEGNPVKAAPRMGLLTLAYANDADVHAERLAEFYRQTAKIMTTLNISGVNAKTAAILLYSWSAQNVGDLTGRRVTSFNTLLNGGSFPIADYDIYMSGGSQSTVYQYLLLQAGIPCVGVTGKLGQANRMWCMVKLGENWYHCDPSMELLTTSGRGLEYFGMSDGDIVAFGFDGVYGCGYDMTGGIYYTNESEYEPEPQADYYMAASDGAYLSFRDCDYFTFDAITKLFSIYHEGIARPDQYGAD